MSDSRPWLAHYAVGVPANIDVNKFKNLNEFFEHCFKKYKTKIAFANNGSEMTFRDLEKQSLNFAKYLHYRGMKPGDKLAIMMPNMLHYPIALVGAIRAGLIIVNTNPLYTEREMLHQFSDSNIKGIIIFEKFASKLEHILPQTKINTIIVSKLGDVFGSFKGGLINFINRNIKSLVPKYNLPNSVFFTKALKEATNKDILKFEDDAERIVFHQYTGGTTGISKGAMLTNRNMIANMLQIDAILKNKLSDDGEVMLTPLPLYHIFALTVNCFSMMYIGAKCVLVTDPRKLKSIHKEFKRNKISLMTGVNTLFNGLLYSDGFAELDFSHLKITVAGGMALQTSVAKKWELVTGCPNTEGYGMTESSPVASVNPIDGSGKLGTIGLPLPSTDMRIVDEEYQPLEQGEIGEIQVKGPQVMKGYYNRPDESRNALRDGWLCTGDIGYMLEDGYFKIVDRKKDMINVSGFNVYPNEVENVIANMDKVLEVACIGVPDEHSSECVKLFIVKKDTSLTEKEVIEYAKENLTGYKRPKHIEFRTELPKTNVGKILRRKLREEETNKQKE